MIAHSVFILNYRPAVWCITSWTECAKAVSSGRVMCCCVLRRLLASNQPISVGRFVAPSAVSVWLWFHVGRRRHWEVGRVQSTGCHLSLLATVSVLAMCVPYILHISRQFLAQFWRSSCGGRLIRGSCHTQHDGYWLAMLTVCVPHTACAGNNLPSTHNTSHERFQSNAVWKWGNTPHSHFVGFLCDCSACMLWTQVCTTTTSTTTTTTTTVLARRLTVVEIHVLVRILYTIMIYSWRIADVHAYTRMPCAYVLAVSTTISHDFSVL